MYPQLLLEAGARVTEIATTRARALGRLPEPLPGVERRIEVASQVNPTDLAQRCRKWGVDRVVAGSEPGVPLSLRLSAALGLPVPRRPRPLYDKTAMMEALAAAGVPNLAFQTLRSVKDGKAFFDGFDFESGSLVLKPAVGAGSVGVVKVSSAKAAADSLTSSLGRANVFGERVQSVLAQEYCAGEEHVVDTFSHNGVHTVANVCAYRKTLTPDGRFVYRGLRWLAPGDQSVPTVSAYACKVLDAVGLRDGCAHLEIMLRGDSPFLIELGARAHGASHPAKTYRLTGDSQVHRDVAYLASHTLPDAGYALKRRGRIVFFSRSQASTVTALSPQSAFANLPGMESLVLHVAAGDSVAATRDLFDSLKLGMCFLTGSSEEDLDRREQDAHAAFGSIFAD
jgi:biotin carboxylase